MDHASRDLTKQFLPRGCVTAIFTPDDVLQEVMITVSTAIRSFVVESEAAFWTWLCRVVEQRLVDVRRRHVQAGVRGVTREQTIQKQSNQSTRLQIQDFLVDSRTSPSAKLARAEQREALADALGRLPDSYREVIVLRVLEGLSVSETAARTEVNLEDVVAGLRILDQRLTRIEKLLATKTTKDN